MNFEVLGIIGTLFVLASFVLSGELKIRYINIVGSVIFVVYGVAIGAFSVWLLNSILIVIHLYKIIQLRKKV